MSTKIKFSVSDFEKMMGGLSFAKLLESYRLSEDQSQKKFALFLGMSQQSLCDLEKGRKIPSADRAAKIAKKLKEPKDFWIKLALQDTLRSQNLHYEVSLADLKIKKAA
jgi:transcriptional regulator with XRE-family HTH domain